MSTVAAQGALAGVVFDLDDTLSDYAAVEARVWATTAQAVSAALPAVELEAARRRFAACREPLYARILSGEWSVDEYRRGQLTEALAPWGVPPETVLAEHCALRDAAVGETVAMAGSAELLVRLRAAGLRVGVLTNGGGELLHRKLAALGIAELLDGVVSGIDLGAPKPAPAAYDAAAAAIGLPADRLAMVGDHLEWDVAAPLRAGFAAALWLDRGHGLHDAAALPPRGAAKITSLAEVPGALGLGLG